MGIESKALAAIPLASAYLCPECNVVGNCAERCPQCAGAALLSLAKILDREDANGEES